MSSIILIGAGTGNNIEVNVGSITMEKEGGEVGIEANDWMSIVVPPYSPASGLFNFKIMVKENDSGASRDGWLLLYSLDMGQTRIPFKQPNL